MNDVFLPEPTIPTMSVVPHGPLPLRVLGVLDLQREHEAVRRPIVRHLVSVRVVEDEAPAPLPAAPLARHGDARSVEPIEAEVNHPTVVALAAVRPYHHRNCDVKTEVSRRARCTAEQVCGATLRSAPLAQSSFRACVPPPLPRRDPPSARSADRRGRCAPASLCTRLGWRRSSPRGSPPPPPPPGIDRRPATVWWRRQTGSAPASGRGAPTCPSAPPLSPGRRRRPRRRPKAASRSGAASRYGGRASAPPPAAGTARSPRAIRAGRA